MKEKSKLLFSAVFLTPATLIFMVLIVIPVVMTVWYSLCKWSGAGALKFIGLYNFFEMLGDRNYKTTVLNSITLMVIALVIQLTFGLGAAFAVSRIKRLYKFFRSVYFLPSVISTVAIGTLFVVFFNADIGPFNIFLRAIGLGPFIKDQSWLGNPKTALYFVAIPQVWQYMGQQFIIFLAAIQSLPEDMFESARIDGANSLTMFFRIALPNLKDIIEVVVILIITGCMKSFDHSWIMTWGGPGYSSSYMAVLMYKEVFKNSDFGYGSAIAVSILLISLLLVILFRTGTTIIRRNEN